MGRAHARHLARLLGASMARGVRGHHARSRSALHAGQRVREDHVARPLVSDRAVDRSGAGWDDAIRREAEALHPADVLGRGGRAAGASRPTRSHGLALSALRVSDVASPRVSRSRRRGSGGRHERRAGRCQGGCLYPNNARACSKHGRAASTIAWCATCSATSPSSPRQPVHGQGRRGTRRCRTAPFSTASRGARIGLLRAAGVTVVEPTLRDGDFQRPTIFPTGNASKVVRSRASTIATFQPGPLYRQAREPYWDYAYLLGERSSAELVARYKWDPEASIFNSLR